LVVSAAIAAALFKAGLPVDSSDPNQRRVLLKALGNLEAMALPETIHNVPICCQRHPTDVLLSSPIKETRLIALRLLPWLKDEERFVYERLTATISDNNCDRDVLVAALTALKLASGVHRMLTILDVLEICKKLNAPYRDVRLAACNALSLLEGSLEIKEALESYITRNGTGGSEFRAAVYALVQSCQDIRQAQNLITPILQKRLKSGHAHRGGVSRETPRKRDTGRRTGGTLHFDSRAQQNRDLLELLRVCQRFDQTDDQTAGLLKSAVVDYSISDDIKEEALSLFARLVKPGKSAVEFYVRLADNPPLGLRRPIYRSISIFVRRCRGKIDYMRSVCPFLDALRDSLLSHVDPHKASGYITFTELETRVTELRRAVDEIEKIMRSHREFSRKISNGD
jgi:hypothetical protein